MIALIKHSFLRLIRQRMLPVAAFVSVMLIVVYYVGFQGFARYSLPIESLSHPAGLANFFAMLLAAYLSVTLLPVDRKIGFSSLMMTKPLAPRQYLAGRFIGALAMLAVVWATLCLTLILTALIRGESVGLHLLFCLAFGFIGQAMIFSLGVLLSQRISPLVAAMLVLMFNDKVFYSLTLNIDGYTGSAEIKIVAQYLVKLIYMIVPQASEFALWGTQNYIFIFDPLRIFLATLYGVGYILLAFILSVKLFERSDW